MEKKTKLKDGQKRKAPPETTSEPKNIKISSPKHSTTKSAPKKSSLVNKSKITKKKTKVVMSERALNINPLDVKLNNKAASARRSPSPIKQDIKIVRKETVVATTEHAKTSVKYPILEDKELIAKFMKVPMNNNQKGRIRQGLKSQLQSSNECLYPDIIHGKLQSVMKNSPQLADSDLRRIRILHNMLKTSLEKKDAMPKVEKTKDKELVKDKKVDKELPQKVQKVKGPKRYVVFLGNLPLDVTKDKIMSHFSKLDEHIKDIRLQKLTTGKKSAFAYMELSNEPSYELALSKHHSMMGNKRINVLYTTQKNSKISKAEAKSKSAKLIALQKSGKLIGSVPLSKKRSHRRMILKKARAKEQAAV